MLDNTAKHDFDRAMNRASWRKILSWLTGDNNQLLPYDEVRARLPIRGQHYIGMHQVPIEKIVGSMGRYNDFDRAFLPKQSRTKERWISIDKAHHSDIILPPVELIKIGEIYFVKDGNHRVSVARERGQMEIDAYITEIDTPIKLTPDVNIDDLENKKKHVEFMQETNLASIKPDSQIELTNPQGYDVMLEHISTHRWYMGIDRKEKVPYEQAVESWYDRVYLPIVQEIRDHNLQKSFPGKTEADLYVWILEYEKYLRLAYSTDDSDEDNSKAIAADQLIKDYPQTEVIKLIQLVNRTNWLEKMILSHERANFLEKTHLLDIYPDAIIETTLPGKYDRLIDHINTHRWYLGEQRKEEVSYEQAEVSWYENVYLPIVQVIREQQVLNEFPNRTETDLYLWIVRHQWRLKEAFGEDIPIEKAAEQVTVQFADHASVSPVEKMVQAIKKVIGQK